eukprot:TRINITY_DN13006_c0_g2_i1.p1 TRINITY_DN13006_c0_g2~~TRINITY_DN13006_c0_g2_i1.p1  ORF type:complete len:751 (+),score=131.93 TRINITY_DN13006_c0_g2_i1:211-2463(+)
MPASKAPTGLAILVDDKRVNDLLAQKSGAKAFLRSAVNVALYMLFVYIFTSLALSEPREKQRAFEGYIRKRFDTHASMKLDDVKSIADFWKYTNVSFMPGIYGNDTAKYSYPGAKVAKMLPIEGANRLYGVARMRIINIDSDVQCLVPSEFKSTFPKCYGGFMEEALSKKEYGPMNEEGTPSYRFMADPADGPYSGKLSSYPPGGFMTAITPDYLKTKKEFINFEKNRFITQSTRAIFYDFTIYNFNLGLYAPCHIVFEIDASGNWLHTMKVDVLIQRHLAALGAGNTSDWLILIGEAVLALFCLRYLLEEASEFMAVETKGGIPRPVVKWEYFGDAWNVLDWANLTIILITLGFKVSSWSIAGNLVVYVGDAKDADVSKYTNFQGVTNNVRLIHQLVSFNTILTWFKAVKFLTLLPYVTTFMYTAQMAQNSLIAWIIVFCACLTGFVLAFSVAFGEQVSEFRTPGNALVWLMQTLVGNAKAQIIYDTAPLLGSMLIVLFVVGIFFVIMNLFYAIIVSTLSDAKQLEDSKHAKKVAQFKDRFLDFRDMLYESFKVEARFRATFPGLYSRLQTRKQKMADMEQARMDAKYMKQQLALPSDLLALGPGSPTLGRRPKRQLASVSIEDAAHSDSEGSEPDIGPLRSQDQLMSPMATAGPGGFSPKGGDDFGFGNANEEFDALDAEEEAMEKVLDATRHVAGGIIERCRGARQVLLAEMTESQEVLTNVGKVLEILGKRARDLEAQQRQVLKNA